MQEKKKKFTWTNRLILSDQSNREIFLYITSGVANSSKIEFTLFLDRHFNDCVELKIMDFICKMLIKY